LRAFSNFVLWLVICCALASCHSPRRFAGTDSSDRPQADLRDKLSSRLPDLFAVPRSPIGYSITRLIRTGFYSEQFDLVAEFDQDTGTTEQIVWYKWDSTAHQYAWRDRLLIEGVASIEVRDIDNDHRNEVILQVTRTSDAAHGLWIIGHRKDSLGLAVRFRSDSTAPTFIRLSDSSLALIEHSESLADRLEGFAPNIPRRFFKLKGDHYQPAPADSVWNQIVQHTRDSVHQVFLLERNALVQLAAHFPVNHTAYLQALAAEVLLDTNIVLGRELGKRELETQHSYLRGSDRRSINTLVTLPFASTFVELANASKDSALAVTLGGLNDALLSGSERSQLDAMHRLLPLVHDAPRATQIAGGILLVTPRWDSLLLVSTQLMTLLSGAGGHSASFLATWGKLEYTLGHREAAVGLFRRSLRFDSLSVSAREIKRLVATECVNQ
jgi:hypothetical protein